MDASIAAHKEKRKGINDSATLLDRLLLTPKLLREKLRAAP